MAQFRGVIPAQAIVPAPFGVLSAAQVGTPTDEHWVRNFNVEFISKPGAVRLLPLSNDAVADGVLYENPDAPDSNFENYDPFYIEVEDTESTLGLLAQDRIDRVLAQLECVTQKAVETELWDGPVATEDANDNLFLAKASGATIVTTAALDPVKALAALEQAMSNSPVGAGGVLHVTRDVASIVFSNGGFVQGEGPNGAPALFTELGTPVVVGSGYTGDGPSDADEAAATATNKWAYITGPLNVLLGSSEVINSDRSQGFKISTNDLSIKAYRPAAVYFDPSIFYAAQIDLS